MTWEKEEDRIRSNWTEYRLLVLKALDQLEKEVGRFRDEVKADIETLDRNVDQRVADLHMKIDKRTGELSDRLNTVNLELSLKLQELESEFSNNAKWAGGIIAAIVSVIVSTISLIMAKLIK